MKKSVIDEKAGYDLAAGGFNSGGDICRTGDFGRAGSRLSVVRRCC